MGVGGEVGTVCCSLAGGSYALPLKTFRRQRWQREPLDFSLFNLVAVSVCKDYQQTEPGHKVQREIKAQMEKETQGFGKLYKCADQKLLLYLYTQVSPKVNCSVKPWTRTRVLPLLASLSVQSGGSTISPLLQDVLLSRASSALEPRKCRCPVGIGSQMRCFQGKHQED